MTIAIIGIGLIGGSLALDLRKRGFAQHILGVGRSEKTKEIALQLNLVDEFVSIEEATHRADIIILCAPVNTNRELLPSILDAIVNTEKTVVDMGSTKVGISEAVKKHPARGRFVATHPMAGTEYSGPEAALENLFDDKIGIICDKELSDPNALAITEKLYATIKMRMIYMSSANHDAHVAYVSHISHITSFALALTVFDKEKNDKNIFNLAGGGFASTVRLAKSNANTWTPIFFQNEKYITEAIDTYIEKMKLFKKFIQERNADELTNLMNEANRIKNILN